MIKPESEVSARNNTRVTWIDAAKFTAILAVIVDHGHSAGLYQNISYKYLSLFSVPLFILLMGMNAFWSCRRQTFRISKKLRDILRPYLMAVFLYKLYDKKGSFDLEFYLHELINVTRTSHFYFVLLYIQLILIAPLLFRLLNTAEGKKDSHLREILSVTAAAVFSVWTTNSTNIFSAYAGGGKLFGGTFLVLFILGMLFAKYHGSIRLKEAQAAVLFALSLALTVGCAVFIVRDQYHFDASLPFGAVTNPPGIILSLYSILIMLTVFFCGQILSFHPSGPVTAVFRFISGLGRHTYYIYLYHCLFLFSILPDLTRNFTGNFKLLRFAYFPILIFVPILIEYLMRFLYRKLIIESYFPGKK